MVEYLVTGHFTVSSSHPASFSHYALLNS